jgi:hypothetical protein
MEKEITIFAAIRHFRKVCQANLLNRFLGNEISPEKPKFFAEAVEIINFKVKFKEGGDIQTNRIIWSIEDK